MKKKNGTITPTPHTRKGMRYKAEAFGFGQRKSKTLDTRRQAQTWINDMLDLWERRCENTAHGLLFHDALDRYAEEIAPKKKGVRWDQVRCKKVMRYPIARVPINEMTVDDAYDYIAEIEKEGVGPDTVIREFVLLKLVLKQCAKWYRTPYPWTDLDLPSASKPRKRIITDKEITAMMKVGKFDFDEPMKMTQQKVIGMWLFSIETGMRCGEIAKLTLNDLDLENSVATLLDTKNGDTRLVPLTMKAKQIIFQLPERLPNQRLFGVSTSLCSSTFGKLRRRAYMHDPENHFRFHDARRLFCTRTARIPSMNVLKLAQIIGHRNVNQLQTYFQESATDIAKEIQAHQSMMAAGGDLANELATHGDSIESMKAKIAAYEKALAEQAARDQAAKNP